MSGVGSKWEFWGCKQRIDSNGWGGGSFPNWWSVCSCSKRWSGNKNRTDERDNNQTFGETQGWEGIDSCTNGGFEEDFVC